METCSRCNLEKENSEFYYSEQNGKLRKRWCKLCFSNYCQDRWRSIKLKAVKLAGGKCNRCGYSKNLAALDFHHLDPSIKESTIKDLMHKKWDTITAEISKCILLCKNCHSEVHFPHMTIECIDEKHIFTKDIDKIRINYQTGICKCGSPLYGTVYCSVKCRGLYTRKVIRPSKEQLDVDIGSMSMVQVGKKYGVSDNAVRKWIREK